MKTNLDTSSSGMAIPGVPSAAQAESLQLTTLVQQFEGMLLTEMLRGMKPDEPEDDDGILGLGGTTLTDTMAGEFGLSLSRGGGLGLGDMLARALARQRGQVDAAGVEPIPGGRDVPALEPSVVPLTLPVLGGTSDGSDLRDLHDSTVTSDFGWRRDPFDGTPRFHAGADLRAAYGSAVQALAGGTVSFAGEKTGYGTTVVVEHGDGRQTLYAHLSAATVQPGDRVTAGQEIARSGKSGRATGPHLHVEAREHGRAVDPRRLETWSGVGQATVAVGGSTSD